MKLFNNRLRSFERGYLAFLMIAMTTTCFSLPVTQDRESPIAIVIHGGAGTINRELMSDEMENRYREVLKEAIDSGYQILKNDGSSTDAIIATITILEDSPLFNAGHGAVFNHDGNIELDASIMQGSDLNAGAVAAVSRVKNPITLALAVLEHSPHVMLVGEGAEMFAQQQGLVWSQMSTSKLNGDVFNWKRFSAKKKASLYQRLRQMLCLLHIDLMKRNWALWVLWPSTKMVTLPPERPLGE